MLRREREEGLGYGSCVETGECTVPCYVVWRVRELEYYWRNCSVFPDPIEVGRVVIRSRGVSIGDSLHLARSHRAPHRRQESEITDMRPVLRARAARACRLRGLVAAERNELRSIGRRALSVSVICKASMMCVISQASIRQCTGN